jgi:hypothetical protein
VTAPAAAWPTVDYSTWVSFPWPLWVPERVRVQVEDVWATPAAWRRDSDTSYAPTFGSSRYISITGGTTVTGRYVHLRGAVGRLVPEGGCPVVVRVEHGRPRWVEPT